MMSCLFKRSLVTLAALCAMGASVAAPVEVLGIWDETPTHVFAGTLPYANPQAPKTGTLKLSAQGSYDNYNPFANRGVSAAKVGLTIESLGESVGTDTFAMRGLLAKAFELAPDRSYLDVWLRKEARFADGHPVTAEDVIYSFNALVKEATPLYRSYYAQVKSVERINDHYVRFHFHPTQNRELPLIVTQMHVLPAHWMKGKSLGDPLQQPMPGSGPYQYVAGHVGSQVVLKRNPNYWGKDLDFNRGRYNFETIQVDYFRDSAVAREAFFAGEVDFHAEYTIKDWMLAYDVPAVQDGRITRSEIDDQAIFGLSGIFLNTRRADLQNIKVREALGLLFDFEWINRSLFYDAYTRCESYFSGSPRLTAQEEITPLEKSILQKHFGTETMALPSIPVSDASGYIRDRLRRAVQLLDEAGYRLKKGVMYKPDGSVFRLNMILSSASLQRIFGAWQRNLARIGIDLKIDFLEQTQYINRLRHFDFDVVYASIGQSSNPGNEQRNYWGTRARDQIGSRNWAGIADERIDAVIEELIAADTAQKHQAYVRVLDRALRAGHYVIAGWYSKKTRVASWTDRIVMPASWEVPERGIDMTVWYKKEGG